uniref:SWIM-type domain-containing protein n=1 Tax=Heligmosomoides polygyrus TaxID=6339 RepID=A0A183GF20_HELPZ
MAVGYVNLLSAAKTAGDSCQNGLRKLRSLVNNGGEQRSECSKYAVYRIIEGNSGVEVNHCRNHLGHLPTVGNFRMDKNSVDYIVRLLKDGFAPSQIICKIRSEFGSDNPRSRLFYITTKDISRKTPLSERFLKRTVLCREDCTTTTLETRVARNSQEDGIQYYQGYKDEDEDGFVMVIITPTQQRWLRKYGRRVLVNEWDMGVPGGYLLSLRYCLIRLVLQNVRSSLTLRRTANEDIVLRSEKLIPDFDPAFFMSDDTNTFYNGFVQEFPEMRSVKLLCLNNHCNRDGCDACPYVFCCTCIADGKAGECCLHIHAAMVAHPEGRQFNFPPEDGNNVCYASDVNNSEADFIAGYPEVDVGNKENVEKMTWTMGKFPLEHSLPKLLTMSVELGCTDEGSTLCPCFLLRTSSVNLRYIFFHCLKLIYFA